MEQVLNSISEQLSLYKFRIGFIDLLLIVMAWLIENADRIPLVEKAVFRRYYLGMKALKKLESERVLHPCDEGFSELSDILKENIEQPANPQIAKIEFLNSECVISDEPSHAEVGSRMTLRFTLTNSTSGEERVINISNIVSSRYRIGPQRCIATILFWIGLLIELALLFI